MSERIRVVQVIQNFHYGGMEQVVGDLVRHLPRSEFELHVLCLGFFGHFSQGLDEFAELHLADEMSNLSMIWPASLISRIRRLAPDVVHTHGRLWYKASLAARRAGVPLLIHTEHGRHAPDPTLHRVLDRAAARRTDIIVAVSERLARVLRDEVKLEAFRIRVVQNGVNTGVHRPVDDTGAIRRELDIPAAVPIIGSIGRLEPVKGYDVMIQAFCELRARWEGEHPPVLVIGGDGSEKQRLPDLARARGVADSVFLLGWRDDVRDLQSAFSVFTLSSHSEGTSVSLLEAMSAGLCPVVTDVGGNAGVLGDSLAHRLVPAGNPAALADEWLRALQNPERRRRDARIARTRIVEAFSLEAMVAAYAELYARRRVEPTPNPLIAMVPA